MDIRASDQRYNPYRIFSRQQWAALRDDTPMVLEPGEFSQLRSLHDRLDIKEVEEIYLPLSRLLSIHVDAARQLYHARRQFLGIRDRKVPHHRYRRLTCGGQVDHRARPASAARTMVATAQSRSGDNRWLSLSQSGA
jgi:pantothenate kinase